MTRVSRRKSRPAHSSSDITYPLPSPTSQGRILSSFIQTFQSPGSSFMTFCTRVLHGTLGKEVEYCIAQRRKQEGGRSGVGGGCEGVMAAVAELSLPCTADRSLEQRCSPGLLLHSAVWLLLSCVLISDCAPSSSLISLCGPALFLLG